MDGAAEGADEGSELGVADGETLGRELGVADGVPVGLGVGGLVGVPGVTVGFEVGALDGGAVTGGGERPPGNSGQPHMAVTCSMHLYKSPGRP
mmetsp:Transcript_21386/g.46211  ORF Transcript_21386/g.46211 Transcript_21386/m.46211 type:complete len:93 (-) Transcript_21386:49-327(-)